LISRLSSFPHNVDMGISLSYPYSSGSTFPLQKRVPFQSGSFFTSRFYDSILNKHPVPVVNPPPPRSVYGISREFLVRDPLPLFCPPPLHSFERFVFLYLVMHLSRSSVPRGRPVFSIASMPRRSPSPLCRTLLCLTDFVINSGRVALLFFRIRPSCDSCSPTIARPDCALSLYQGGGSGLALPVSLLFRFRCKTPSKHNISISD